MIKNTTYLILCLKSDAFIRTNNFETEISAGVGANFDSADHQI
jgi:hypothetical protein